jgi:hypothetical protein
MTAVVTGAGPARHGWRLVSRTGQGADVLARAAAASRLPSAEALERLRDGDGTLSVVRGPGAHFRWILTGAGGVIAESPPIYRDTDSCREAFLDARHAARSALGGARHHPRSTLRDRAASDVDRS